MNKVKLVVIGTLVGTAALYMTNRSYTTNISQDMSSQIPIEVSKVPTWDSYGNSYEYIRITSITDSIEIQSIVLNRGNCVVDWTFSGDPRLPASLQFGSQETFKSTCKGILEAVVKTDKGEWKFSFQS
jgi:hypothetical protein